MLVEAEQLKQEARPARERFRVNFLTAVVRFFYFLNDIYPFTSRWIRYLRVQRLFAFCALGWGGHIRFFAFSRKRKAKTEVPPDHWLLRRRLLPALPECLLDINLKKQSKGVVHLSQKFVLSEGFRRHKSEIYHNAKLKRYPDGYSLTIASKPIFRERGWEKAWEEPLKPKPKTMSDEVRPDNLRRARQRVYDIARLNLFRWFITWTLDKRCIDRYDRKGVSKAMKTFLMNKVKRNAAIYLIIPEYHQDLAIHAHGLLAGDFKMLDSGRRTKGGNTVYNMPDWKLGYSTAIELDENIGAISRYITKYISKDSRKIFGSFYYAGGHGLLREPPSTLYDLDYSEVNAKEYASDFVSFKYLDFEGSTSANTYAILEVLSDMEHEKGDA